MWGIDETSVTYCHFTKIKPCNPTPKFEILQYDTLIK
jgi:hypothetical protein